MYFFSITKFVHVNIVYSTNKQKCRYTGCKKLKMNSAARDIEGTLSPYTIMVHLMSHKSLTSFLEKKVWGQFIFSYSNPLL